MKKENLKLTVLSCSYCRNFTISVLIVFAFIWSLADSTTFCQTGPKSQEKDSVYQKVDKMPLFNEKEAGTFDRSKGAD